MAYIITGEPLSWKKEEYGRKDFDYTYPDDLKLKPGTDFHDKLRSMIWQRASEARNSLSKRFDSWREIDRTLTTYIDLSDKEEEVKDNDVNKPTSIVFPYSYSSLEAILTYLSMAFFQDPIFKYEGVEDSDTIGAILMELVVRLHTIKNKMPLNLHTMFRDASAYGIGAVIPEWARRWGKKAKRRNAVIDSPLGQSFDDSIDFVEELLFEGNALSNIDPYMLLLDPSVSSVDIQKGEFFGWVDRTNYMAMLSEENEPDSDVFNVKYLKDKLNRRSTLALDQSDREIKYSGTSDLSRSMTNSTNPVDNINMYVTLIPKDWELSSSERPEKWFFRLSSDDVITKCLKADHNHGMYPVAVASPEYDGYSSTPIGRLEIAYGLQHTLDFLFNSHIANVRKAINDMLVVDPYLVNIEDLKDPQPGKLIRLRRPAWGRGVDKVVQQLGVQDITRANVQDAGFITTFMDRILGVDGSMQGIQRQGGPERLTRNSAMSRLQRVAMIISMQAMQDIGTMCAVHTQQYMSKTTYVKAIGQHAEVLMKTFGKTNVPVSVYDLAIDYDLLPRDGSIPGGNFSNGWFELFKVIGTTPELLQQFDVTRIFMYMARQMGATNVEDFRRNINRVQPKVVGDEQVMNQVQAGNMIPAGAMQ
jgi:hypothetical protein